MSRYSNYVMKNNVFAELVAPISSLATTIQLKTGQGDRRGSTFPILATLEHTDSGKVTKREIVQITARSGDYLTVVRGYANCPKDDDTNSQGTTTFSFDIDDRINLYITKEHFDNIENGFINAENELDELNYDGNSRMKVIKAISGTALKIDIIAGVYRCGQDTLQYAGGTDISVSDNATNYVMLDGAGTVQISTSSRDTRYTRLAEVICSGGIITSISDRRSDVVGGTLGGLEIHSLTEKISPVNDDELVLADSEDSYVNKRVKYGVIGVSGIACVCAASYPVTFSDTKGYIAVNVTQTSRVYITGPNGALISQPSYNGISTAVGTAIIHNGVVWIVGKTNGDVRKYDIINGNSRESVATITTGLSFIGVDKDGYFCLAGTGTDKNVYRYNQNMQLVDTLTFNDLSGNIYANGSTIRDGEYWLNCNSGYSYIYVKNKNGVDLYPPATASVSRPIKYMSYNGAIYASTTTTNQYLRIRIA